MKLQFSIKEKRPRPSFGSYIAGSAINGEIQILTDISQHLIYCAENPKIDFYDLISEISVHEMIHAFQELYKRAFDEEEVEDAIRNASEFVNNSPKNEEEYNSMLKKIKELEGNNQPENIPELKEIDFLKLCIWYYEKSKNRIKIIERNGKKYKRTNAIGAKEKKECL